MAEETGKKDTTKSATKGSQGTQCYAFNCNNYRNQESKAQGLSFHV